MKPTKTLPLFGLIIFLGIKSHVFAQTNPYGEVSISSPTSASLGKYADYPVSYHTGTPQIDIPLYEIKAGSLHLPISLSYHASGIKVAETASWVGMGWSLNAGGMITRTVMGLPDEKGTNSGATENYGFYSDYGFNKYLYPAPNAEQDWQGFAENRNDGQPDLFFFNFGGYSGKFIFRDDRTVLTIPQSDLKIIPYYPNPSKSIQGFTIVTPDGVKYFFGNSPGFSGSVLPVELTNPYTTETGYSTGTALSSWYLNRTESADGQFRVDFSYVSENYGYYIMASHPIDSSPPSAPTEINLIKNITNGVRLSQISFPNGTVTFNAGSVRSDLANSAQDNLDNVNTESKTLGSIDIVTSGSVSKRYRFNYGYFTDNTSPQATFLTNLSYTMTTDKSCLRLDSVNEESIDGSIKIPPRRFSYFSEKRARRLTLGQDHWGYFNGVNSNQTLIPTFQTNDGTTITTVTGANRSAAWPAMRGGALQQITYPTGGTTTFEFEPADSYTSATTTLQAVQRGSLIVKHSGQSAVHYSTAFTVNANPITISFTTYANYALSFQIKNSSNVVVYDPGTIADNNYPASQVVNYHVTLSAGNYYAYLSVDTATADGATCAISQQDYVTSYNAVVIGGLRIKTISTSDQAGVSSTMVKNFTYPNGGYLYQFPTYLQHLKNDIILQYGYYLDEGSGWAFQHNIINASGCAATGGYYVKSGGSLRPMSSVQGSHMGYQSVRVSETGNGFSEYHYYLTNTGFPSQTLDPSVISINNSLTGCGANDLNYPAAPLQFDYRKGELAYEVHYKENGDLLKDIYYYPEYDAQSTQPVPGFIVDGRHMGSTYLLLGTSFNLSIPRKTKTTTYQTDYQPGGNSLVSKNILYYSSPYHNQATRSVVSTSTGDSLIKQTKYSPDYHVSSWDVSPACESVYTDSCNACLAAYNLSTSGCGGNSSCISDNVLIYRRCLSRVRNNYVDCQVANYTGPTNNYQAQHNISKASAASDLKPILDLQDSFRIVPIEEAHWKNNNLIHSAYYSYRYISTPATIPFIWKTQLINLQTPTSTFTASTVSGSAIAVDSRYQDESNYVFAAGNPAQVVTHGGVATSYVWDYLNTEPIAKVSNAASSQIAYTSFEADGKGSWSFTGPTVLDAAAITGLKDYALSGGAITRSGLDNAKSYVVSYWSKTGSATVNSGTASALMTRNGWTYYEHTIATGTTTVTVSGSVTIDELRLFPSDAQITTYTYSPLVGMTSTCDPQNKMSYYLYDALGRLQAIKDQDGNILKTIQYQYYDQTPSLQ